jgi:hypothetical protein
MCPFLISPQTKASTCMLHWEMTMNLCPYASMCDSPCHFEILVETLASKLTATDVQKNNHFGSMNPPPPQTVLLADYGAQGWKTGVWHVPENGICDWQSWLGYRLYSVMAVCEVPMLAQLRMGPHAHSQWGSDFILGNFSWEKKRAV